MGAGPRGLSLGSSASLSLVVAGPWSLWLQAHSWELHYKMKVLPSRHRESQVPCPSPGPSQSHASAGSAHPAVLCPGVTPTYSGVTVLFSGPLACLQQQGETLPVSSVPGLSRVLKVKSSLWHRFVFVSVKWGESEGQAGDSWQETWFSLCLDGNTFCVTEIGMLLPYYTLVELAESWLSSWGKPGRQNTALPSTP